MSAAAPSIADLVSQGVGQLTASPNPQTSPAAIPGSGINLSGIGAPQADTSPMFSLDPSQVLPTQMTFPGAYSGPMADAQYMADEASLRYSTAKQYSDLLNQLGYVDPATGKTIQG